MPIYEYRCEACDHEFEAIQKISDSVLTECPQCGAPKLKKLISAAGFKLKGNGWYATDFKDQKGSTSKAKTKDGAATTGVVGKKKAGSSGN